MGASLIGGMLKAGVTDRDHREAATKSREHAEQVAQRFSISATAGGNITAVQHSDVIIVAVKPLSVPYLIEEVRDHLRPTQSHAFAGCVAAAALCGKAGGNPDARFSRDAEHTGGGGGGCYGDCRECGGERLPTATWWRAFSVRWVWCVSLEEENMDAVTALLAAAQSTSTW